MLILSVLISFFKEQKKNLKLFLEQYLIFIRDRIRSDKEFSIINIFIK